MADRQEKIDFNRIVAEAKIGQLRQLWMPVGEVTLEKVAIKVRTELEKVLPESEIPNVVNLVYNSVCERVGHITGGEAKGKNR